MSTAQPGRPGLDGIEQAAVRKIVYQLAELDGGEIDPDDNTMLDAANQALENVAGLAERLERAEAQIEALEERAPEPSKKAYDAMDKSDKATVVRSKLRKEAEATNGRAAATYKDIIRMFDGNPSAGHAYGIMELAGEADGYEYGSGPDGSKRLTANLGKIPE